MPLQGHHEIRGTPLKRPKRGAPKRDRSALIPRGGTPASPPASSATPAAHLPAPESAAPLASGKLPLPGRRKYVAEDQ